MVTYLGIVLLMGIVGGGIYLYAKVEKLDREIARQKDLAAQPQEEGAPDPQ